MTTLIAEDLLLLLLEDDSGKLTNTTYLDVGIGGALVRGVQPGERIAALVALVSALDLAHKVVDREGLAARDIQRRAKALAEGD